MEKAVQRKELFEVQEKNRRQMKDERSPDWHFELLAEFEDMLKEYGQDHVSPLN